MDHDPGGRAALLGQAEAAVADAPAWRTHPLRAPQHVHDVLSIAVLEAGSAELPANAVAVFVVADGFGIDCLLPALVARGAVDLIVDLVRALVDDAASRAEGAGWLSINLDWEGLGVYAAPHSRPVCVYGGVGRGGISCDLPKVEMVRCILSSYQERSYRCAQNCQQTVLVYKLIHMCTAEEPTTLVYYISLLKIHPLFGGREGCTGVYPYYTMHLLSADYKWIKSTQWQYWSICSPATISTPFLLAFTTGPPAATAHSRS